MKKILALLLALLMLTGTVACGAPGESDSQTENDLPGTESDTESEGGSESESEGGSESESESEEDERVDLSNVPFVPSLRFIVTSDSHITPTTGAPASRLEAAMKQILEYVNDPTQNEGYAYLDAVAVVGDITNNGTTEEFTVAKKFFDGIIPQGTELLLAMGNHDWNTFGADSRAEFEEILGPAMVHLVLGGYHFITVVNDASLGWRGYGWDYSADTVKRLEKMIDSAIADTGKDKPVFVFQHIGNTNTVVGTGEDVARSNTSVSTLTELQSRYPNLVVFSGHSHFPMNDECSIHQKDFTSINTGALTAGMASRNNGTEIPMASRSAAKSVYLIEVDEYGRTRIRIWRTEINGFMGEEWFLDSFRKKDFIYTEGRFSEDDLFFAEKAKVAVYDVFSTSAAISFLPVPAESLSARIYEVVVTDTSGKVVSTNFISPEYYVDDFNAKMQMKLEGLQPNTQYTVSVYAVNALYNVDIASEGTLRSKPLTATFTTPAAGLADGADIVDIRIYTDAGVVGSANADNLMPTIIGAPVLSYDDAVGMDVVSVDGAAGNLIKFSYNSFSDQLTDGFTVEAYLRVDEKPSGDAVLFGAMHAGGFALIARPDGTLRFDLYDGASYQKISSAYTVGVYHHVAATFDGSFCRLYVDGKEAGSIAMNTFALPTNPSYRQLYLGADSYVATQWQTSSKCTVAKFALDSDVMTSEQVLASYNALVR